MQIKIVTPVYFIIAVSYSLSMINGGYSASFIGRGLPLIILTIFSNRFFSETQYKSITIAIAAAALSNLLIELPFSWSFITSLTISIISSLIFIYLFSRNIHHSIPRILLATFIILYGLLLGDMLHLKLESFLIPVITHIFMLTVLAIFSVMGTENHPYSAVGAILLLITSSIPLVSHFVLDIPNMALSLLLIIYFISHWLICFGFYRNCKTN